MGEIRVIDACVECGGTSFTDLPDGSATARWSAAHEHPHTMCDECGCWFWQEAVEPHLRKAGPDAPADGNYHQMFKIMREDNQQHMDRELASLKAKVQRLEDKKAAKGGRQ